jgi:hypothetical protein
LSRIKILLEARRINYSHQNLSHFLSDSMAEVLKDSLIEVLSDELVTYLNIVSLLLTVAFS